MVLLVIYQWFYWLFIKDFTGYLSMVLLAIYQ